MDTGNDVKFFMEAADQIPQTVVEEFEQSHLYMSLIAEEYAELVSAYIRNDRVEIADALADLKWVIEGLEITLKLPQQAIWDEVARSNLSKISSTGKILKRADGKVQKPDTYSPPDIASILKTN